MSRLARLVYAAGVAIATRAWGEAAEMWKSDGELGVPKLEGNVAAETTRGPEAA